MEEDRMPKSMRLSILSFSTVCSLACVFHSVNDLPYYFEVSKPFQSFLDKEFTVKVEESQWQTASLFKPRSNLRTSCLPSVQPYFNNLSHVQVPNQSSFTPLDTSYLWNMYQFGPVYSVKCLLPVYFRITRFRFQLRRFIPQNTCEDLWVNY